MSNYIDKVNIEGYKSPSTQNLDDNNNKEEVEGGLDK